MAPRFKHSTDAIAADTGMPIYLGRYDATVSSKTNSQATDAFNATGNGLAGKTLLLLNNGVVEISVYPVATATATVTRTYAAAANLGVPVAAGARVTLRMGNLPFLAVMTASSTANVDVWELV